MPDKNISHGKGFFKNAHRFIFWKPTLVDSSVDTINETVINHNINNTNETVINNNTNTTSKSRVTVIDNSVSIVADSRLVNDSIKLLEKYTIQGAEHDSSERDPPPQCHPGTRLQFCESIQSWMCDSSRAQKVLWLHGPAGVGKSAIMQTIAELEANSSNSTLGATIFFSRPNERDDLKRLFTTVAYQLAVRYPLYRQYVVDILTNDGRIVMKSISEQFKVLIVKPFTERNLFHGLRKAVSIVLDGLDECKGEEAQRELILLIGRFTLQHPTAPLIWLIASRPEPHIHSAFTNSQIKRCYWDVDVPVDSDQACADVEHFLQDKFLEIRERYSSLFPPGDGTWPSEVNFLKIASAASGHFLFADLTIRFVVDESYGNPVAQLQTVLDVIEATPESEIRLNPFALLDNLYTQILASVSPDVLPMTKRLLAWLFDDLWNRPGYHLTGTSVVPWPVTCNWLNLDQAASYSALRKLHSVIVVPSPDSLNEHSRLRVFHASFTDYLKSSIRSGEYRVTTTLEEVMPCLVEKLLESHNLENSTVDPSRMQVSWAWGRSKYTAQSAIWRETFYRIVAFLGERDSSEERKSINDDRLVALFRDLDYGDDFFVDSHEALKWPFASPFCRNLRLFETLRDWGIAKTIDLQSIDLDHVRPLVAGGTLYSLGRQFIHPPFFHMPGHVRVHCKTTGWKSLISQHLNELAQLQTPLLAALIGKGSKSAVWITSPGAQWYYTFPYNEF